MVPIIRHTPVLYVYIHSNPNVEVRECVTGSRYLDFSPKMINLTIERFHLQSHAHAVKAPHSLFRGRWSTLTIVEYSEC